MSWATGGRPVAGKGVGDRAGHDFAHCRPLPAVCKAARDDPGLVAWTTSWLRPQCVDERRYREASTPSSVDIRIAPRKVSSGCTRAPTRLPACARWMDRGHRARKSAISILAEASEGCLERPHYEPVMTRQLRPQGWLHDRARESRASDRRDSDDLPGGARSGVPWVEGRISRQGAGAARAARQERGGPSRPPGRADGCTPRTRTAGNHSLRVRRRNFVAGCRARLPGVPAASSILDRHEMASRHRTGGNCLTGMGAGCQRSLSVGLHAAQCVARSSPNIHRPLAVRPSMGARLGAPTAIALALIALVALAAIMVLLMATY